MPNVRSTDKLFISAWVPKELRKELEAIARREGKSMTEVMTEVLDETLKKRAAAPTKKSPPKGD